MGTSSRICRAFRSVPAELYAQALCDWRRGACGGALRLPVLGDSGAPGFAAAVVYSQAESLVYREGRP